MQAWAITDRGAVRQENQDNLALLQPGDGQGLAIVCDGMGGAKAGNVASRLAVDTFVTVMGQHAPEDWGLDPHDLLRRCAAAANQAVRLRAASDAECEGMGTTVVAALVLGEQAHVLNVGDSRAYHINEFGGIHRVTRDHSVVEDLVSRGEITPEEARLHPQKNLITKALGSEPHVEGDVYDVKLASGDFLLLCSDGLSNLMDDQEMAYEVLHGGEPETCCERLLKLTMSRGAPDNVTVVLLQK